MNDTEIAELVKKLIHQTPPYYACSHCLCIWQARAQDLPGIYFPPVEIVESHNVQGWFSKRIPDDEPLRHSSINLNYTLKPGQMCQVTQWRNAEGKVPLGWIIGLTS